MAKKSKYGSASTGAKILCLRECLDLAVILTKWANLHVHALQRATRVITFKSQAAQSGRLDQLSAFIFEKDTRLE